MEVRCPNCGKQQEVTAEELAILRKQRAQLKCSKCGIIIYKYEPTKCTISEGSFESEDELYCPIMNGLIARGATVWNCRQLRGSDYILLHDQMFIPVGGDLPFMWGQEYYIAEVKYQRLRVKRPRLAAGYRGRPLWYVSATTVNIYNDQRQAMRRRGGIFVFVAEPYLEVGYKSMEAAQAAIDRRKDALGKSKMGYEVIITTPEQFQVIYDVYLGPNAPKPLKSYTLKGGRSFVVISFSSIANIVSTMKNGQSCILTKRQIMSESKPSLADLIVDVIEEKKK